MMFLNIITRIIRIGCFSCIGFLISANRYKILSFFRRRAAVKLLRSNWSVQDDFFTIHAMLREIGDYIPHIKDSWPFFDGIDESQFSEMDTVMQNYINYAFSVYNEVMGPLLDDIDNLHEYSISDLKRRNKVVRKLAKSISKELGMLSVIYNNMIIIRYITNNKDVDILTETNEIIKYRLLKINTGIELYNRVHKKRES